MNGTGFLFVCMIGGVLLLWPVLGLWPMLAALLVVCFLPVTLRPYAPRKHRQ